MTVEIGTVEAPNIALGLIKNKEKLKTLYTPPDPEHYPNGYLWDSGFHAIIYARSGLPHLAQEELEAVFSWQDKETGFIANQKFHPTKGTKHFERKYVFGKDAKTSKYSQPPILAHAAWETYEAFIRLGKVSEAENFLSKNYDSLSTFFNYFMDERENGGSLIKIIHPHESGRDFDPTFDFTDPFILKKTKIPVVKSLIDKANMATSQATRFLWALNWARHDFDPDMLNLNDIMFNAIYQNGLTYMSKIAETVSKPEDADFFDKKSKEVGEDIMSKLWDKEDRMFYDTRNGDFIKKVSINNLTAILVPQINSEQLDRVLELMEDPQEFGTYYPLPSVPVSSPYFDPDFKEWGSLWRGGVWLFTNFLLEKALRERAQDFRDSNPWLSTRCKTYAYILRRQTIEMVNKNGEAEFYNTFTGDPQRKEVSSFGPSHLAHVM